MKDLNNQKFEESWRKALADGEIDPSPSVWSNIELDLMQAEGDTMPLGRLLFTQYLLPFEIVSILLLAAMVGVILLSKKDLK